MGELMCESHGNIVKELALTDKKVAEDLHIFRTLP